MIFTLVLSMIYLAAEKLIVKKPLSGSIQRAFISIGSAGVISGFGLYFIGGG